MASPPDPRARIITHMNADHQDSLVRYLEHYHQVPSSKARHASLMNIDLDGMIITTSTHTHDKPQVGDATYSVRFDPPMTSFTEARDRVVAMDKLCISALGREPITLKHYQSPLERGGVDLFTTLLVLSTMLLMHRRAWLVPESAPALLSSIWLRFPAFSTFLYDIQPMLVVGMALVHGGEAWLLDRTRLRKYSVPRGSALWWKWIVGTFVGGFPNFQKIDEWAAKAKEEREKKKH